MTIRVVSAIGSGKTMLSAFDNALKNAGVFNYNLIMLSSIVPKGTKVVKMKKYSASTSNEVGYRLYVVKADIRSDHSGKYIASGLGWYLFPGDGGIFVEHEAEGFVEETVIDELKFKIAASLQDLCEFRGKTFHKNKMQTNMAICKVTNKPGCALTLAIYQAQGWRNSK